ncbi:acyl-CoA dehydrogenase family protein [Novosphingobium sp. G106]|uniref:acyl-CoA dehydrogenase family protein n=1 Tax=Novosphingobium sp. G106 TaxID=2849500 RepID=UPI001C2D9B8D|nr:acyl-CoA dehydrogenase family protein [Novosphingobium sp. G106]MBV1688910.1 acyl-CoA dehydrogenase family protein [Novosphingobium sp. G106]
MIIDLKDDLPAFRQALRDWLAETLPAGWSDAVDQGSEEDYLEHQKWWMAECHKQGLAVPHWPTEYGGAGLSLTGQVVLADEMARNAAPRLDLFVVSLNHIPGTLIPFGTPKQKQQYLPEIPKGTIWCQGFSEPGAGSDLASLRCKAERDGDHYVVNGQKIWSSFSMFAKHCILLVRTDFEAVKQAGITFLVMDMDTPGLEVRPIKQLNGQSEFGELFLTDVRIPVENRVGEENAGWKVTQATLASERGVLWFDWAERRRYSIERFYREALENGAAWLEDDQLRREFMTLFAEHQAGRRMIRQLLRENDGHGGGAAMTSAFVKLHDTTLRQRIADLLVRIDQLGGQEFLSIRNETVLHGMYDFMSAYGATISGGTTEIMHNIIAERGLGLPKG